MNTFFLLLQLSELGKKIANPNASTNNLVKLNSCDCSPLPSCEDKIEATLTNAQVAGNIESIMFDGESFIPDSTISSIDREAIRDFLESVIMKKETSVSVTVDYDSATKLLSVKHIGQLSLESVTIAGTEIETTRCCNLVMNTEYKSFVVDDLTIVLGENSATLANSYPYDASGDANDAANNLATAAQLKTDFEAALTAVGVDTANKVSVTVDDENQGFEVTYYSVGQQISAEGVAFTNCGTKQAFVCM